MTTPDRPHARWRLPAAPLRGRALGAAALGCLGAAALAMTVYRWLATSTAQPVIAMAVFVVMMAVVLAAMREHHPFPSFGLANHITMMRAVLVAVAASLIIEPAQPSVAWTLVFLTAIIAALDGVDGWLARRMGMSSAFGARFDMEVDAFFMLVLSVLVWRHQKAGPWVIAIGAIRYAFVAAGWFLPWLSRPFRATRRGKTVAMVQLAGLGVALAPPVVVPMSAAACAVALAALVWSFAVDVHFLWTHRTAPLSFVADKKRARPTGRARDRR